MSKEIANICSECKKQLTYTPNAEAPFCEFCGAKVFQSEDNLLHNTDKTSLPQTEQPYRILGILK